MIMDTKSTITNKGRFILKNLSEKQKQMLLTGSLGVSGLGIGALLGKNYPHVANSEVTNDNIEDTEISEAVCVETEVPFCITNTDQLSFDEAFQIARKEIGKGGFFEWNGETYNTYYKEEWDDMSEDEMQDYWAAVDSQTDTTTLEVVKSSSKETVNAESDLTDIKELEVETIDNEVENFDWGYGDTIGNGSIDTVAVDQNLDGNADVVALFEGGKEYIMVDTDFDNKYDLLVVENLEDTQRYTEKIVSEEQVGAFDMDKFMSEEEAEKYNQQQTDQTTKDSMDQANNSDIEYHQI